VTVRAPLTPELVDQRLSELQQLSRLGGSLLEAELPPIDRRLLERRSVRVVARANGHGSDGRDLRLHVSPAAVDRHLGWMPDAWVDPVSGLVVGTGLTMLVGALVNGRDVDALPRGHGGLLTLRFLSSRPECVDALPLLERSDQQARLWLCAGRDRARTQW
jgi:hypothetical protein